MTARDVEAAALGWIGGALFTGLILGIVGHLHARQQARQAARATTRS